MSKFELFLSGDAKKNTGAVAAAKQEFTRRLLLTCFVLVLACLAGLAYISRAWFASNKDVKAENSSVTAESGTQNLFIRLNSDPSSSFYSSVSKDWSDDGKPGLYPISTADCENWYYISGRTIEYSPKDSATGITTGEYYASEYTKASPNNDGIYTGYADQSRRAYYCSQYNLYSDKGELDVYLNPTNPIVVDIREDDTNRGLMEAIRVAVVNSDGLVFVYAPVAETGTGKNLIADGTKASANTFYAVTGPKTAVIQTPTSAEVPTNFLVEENGLADYKGGTVTNDPHSFTAGKKKICTATTTGADLSVYIWMEGMDAQSIINVADNRTINVTLNFVGVPVEATSTQGSGTGT